MKPSDCEKHNHDDATCELNVEDETAQDVVPIYAPIPEPQTMPPSNTPDASTTIVIDPPPQQPQMRRSTRLKNPIQRFVPRHHTMFAQEQESEKAQDLSERCFDNPSLAEAKARADWHKWFEAIQLELNTLDEMNVFKAVPRPNDRNVLPGTWVLKRKRDENGRITKYKARLCVRGDRQVPDVDFSETFAPTATATTVRILFALLVQLSLTIATAHLSEDIYMKPPPYFMHQIPANFVLKLLMSL